MFYILHCTYFTYYIHYKYIRHTHTHTHTHIHTCLDIYIKPIYIYIYYTALSIAASHKFVRSPKPRPNSMCMFRMLLQCVPYEEEDTCDNVSCVVAMCVI
jgi:hypothetical protein